MRKRTAIIVSGTLLCSIVGYFAWCLRPFHALPPLQPNGSVSSDGWKAAEEWALSPSYPRPLKFTRNDAFWNLSHPWDRRTVPPVVVTEIPGSGLWATNESHRFWTFSKVRGKWDPSTATSISPLCPGISFELVHWGTIASRLEAWDAGGAVIEVISLGPPVDSWVPRAKRKRKWFNNSTEVFYEYTVRGRVRVLDDRERQELVEAFTRSIREGENSMVPPYHYGLPTSKTHTPPHAIVFTKGEEKLEFMMWFDLGGGMAFGDGVDLPHDSDGSDHFSRFQVSPHAAAAFDAFLERHQMEMLPPAKKP